MLLGKQDNRKDGKRQKENLEKNKRNIESRGYLRHRGADTVSGPRELFSIDKPPNALRSPVLRQCSNFSGMTILLGEKKISK